MEMQDCKHKLQELSSVSVLTKAFNKHINHYTSYQTLHRIQQPNNALLSPLLMLFHRVVL